MRRAIVLALLVAAALVSASSADATTPAQNRAIICKVFGPYCSQAISVSRCESGHNTWATNGQYLGLFQMGSFARSRYGHGSSAWTQARAAYRYFVDSGKDWSPWSCKP
jgi:hypothetical protein